MSNRVRKQSDGPVGKGPIRATLPVSSVMRPTGGLRKSCGNSPTLSPTNAWRRISPDTASSGQRSPGALNYKGKSRPQTELIRRTASLDTLYHKGQWQKDFYIHAGHLQIDKSTQTDDGACSVSAMGQSTTFAASSTFSARPPRATDDDKFDSMLRMRLQRTPHKSPPNAYDHVGSYRYVGTMGPLRATHSSVEALNQEIERLVLCPSGGPPPLYDRLRDKTTPDGHRAPLAEMLRRSVNTQTPQDSSSQTTHSSGPSSRDSQSEGSSPERRIKGGSVCSSPDVEGSKLGTSPHINRFLARKPPDGCERVELKCSDALTCVNVVCAGVSSGGDASSVPRPSVTGFTLRPSLGSAFQPLQVPSAAKKSLDFRSSGDDNLDDD